MLEHAGASEDYGVMFLHERGGGQFFSLLLFVRQSQFFQFI
jgi:hypothetical protein